MTTVDSNLFVVFGATGDLARRKLLHSLYRVMNENELADRTTVLGVALDQLDDHSYRAWARKALVDSGLHGTEVDQWCEERLFYRPLDQSSGSLEKIAHEIADLEQQRDLPGNRVLYLALPPNAVPGVIGQLGSAGLTSSAGWTRVVIEKPFGRDLASARLLNQEVLTHFEEKQVYRIDHYLGKETVQNLLAFRFANPLFESTWNRDRVESVEITVAEDVGVEARAAYYEQAGVVRDMVQNHLTQVLSLIAMEAPNSFTPDAIRNEKVQVVEAIRPIDPSDVVYGQYTSGVVGGTAVPGYREIEGVAGDSNVPTFVAMRLFVDNWRWEGVPFYLRTGKRLPTETTQVAIKYRKPPVCLFHGRQDECNVHQNLILITLQPGESFSISFDIKAPGNELRLVSHPLQFSYTDAFERLPDAYQTLILDVLEGDQTLFVRDDEVEASWRLYDPVLTADIAVHDYPAGTWGPVATNAGIALGSAEWTMRE